MQCLPRIRRQYGTMEKCVTDAASNFHSLNESIIVAIVVKYFVRNAQVKRVHCLNLASKRRYAVCAIHVVPSLCVCEHFH